MKGEYNQECNITSCQKPNSAVWFNHSTRKYYCPLCAKRLNEDIFNKRDAQEMFGHSLCTFEEKERGITIQESIEKDNAIMLCSLKDSGAIQEVIKTGRENRRERRARVRKNK